MEGSPLSRFPPINASSSMSTSTNGASGKRKSTLLTFLRRPSAEGNTIAVPQRQSVFHDMERQPQKPLRHEELLNAAGEEKDIDPNLPTVRLVPPDGENMAYFVYTMDTDEQPDEGEPMMLYPFPLSPPPSLDTQSPPRQRTPPFSPSTPSPLSRRPPLATANRSRPTSTYASNPAWNGMADGFVLPPPRFSRSGAGFNPRGRASVVMPKTKIQVVEEKKRRMSAMMEWEMGYGGAERSAMNRPMSLGQEMKPPNVLEAEKERAAMANVASQSRPTKPDEEEKIEELSEEPVTDTSTPSAPTAPGPPTVTIKTESPVTSQPPSQLPKDDAPRPSTFKPSRRSRTLSLSAAFSVPLFTKNESPTITSAPPIPPVPPVPREQTKRVPKKQKSLKNLFFSSSTPPEATLGPSKYDNFSPVAEAKPVLKDKTERPKEKKPMLSRPRSKPSLHIDIDATKPSSSLKSAPAAPSSSKTSATPITPALSSGRSEKTNSIPATPSTASTATTTPTSTSSVVSKPKLNKRFSLSNMAVFKKRSNSAPSVEHRSLADMVSGNATEEVPKVPELPKAYKKEKEARRTMSEMLPAKEEVAVVPPAPLANEIVTSPVAEMPKGPIELPSTHSADISADDSSLIHSPRDSTATIEPTSASMSSDMSDVDDEDDILNAQFMQLPSPRSPIDRDPALSLQDFLNSAPGRKSEVVVVQEGRRSLEALVVLGPTSVRPNTVSTNSRMSASGSEASFASCDSGSTLNFGTSPQRKQSLYPSVEVRRDSASSDASDDIEGLVTPVQDSVEMFRVQRQRQESQSEESNAGESTDSEGMRNCGSSRKMGPTVPAIDSSSTSKSAPTRALPAPPATMSLEEKKKLGSLHFDNLGLNFGEWDERGEEVSVRT